MSSISKLKQGYNDNKSKKVGEKCQCPSCGEFFVKEHYQQVFCKTKHGTQCKDYYWNNVTPTKRNNTTRISPANRRYYDNVIVPNREWSDLDDGMDYLLDCGDR